MSKVSEEDILWLIEALRDKPQTDLITKKMFGGIAVYYFGKLILLYFNQNNETTYKNKVYPFELWQGLMFPAEKEFHSRNKSQFKFLINHPILEKWLYLLQEESEFEEKALKIIDDIRKNLQYWGTLSKKKKKTTALSHSKQKHQEINSTDSRKQVSDHHIKSNLNEDYSAQIKRLKKISLQSIKGEKINLKQPQIFADQNAETILAEANKISDLKNLGLKAEQEFLQAGIKTVAQFTQLGWKKSLEKLIKLNPKNAHSVYGFAIYGALNNKVWHKLTEVEKKEIQDFCKKWRTKNKTNKNQNQR